MWVGGPHSASTMGGGGEKPTWSNDWGCGMHIYTHTHTYRQPLLVGCISIKIHCVDDKGLGEGAGESALPLVRAEGAAVVVFLEAVEECGCVVCMVSSRIYKQDAPVRRVHTHIPKPKPHTYIYINIHYIHNRSPVGVQEREVHAPDLLEPQLQKLAPHLGPVLFF